VLQAKENEKKRLQEKYSLSIPVADADNADNNISRNVEFRKVEVEAKRKLESTKHSGMFMKPRESRDSLSMLVEKSNDPFSNLGLPKKRLKGDLKAETKEVIGLVNYSDSD
jgi:hypothetical protein